eukprot:1923562-Prymnesium_polylepis.1
MPSLPPPQRLGSKSRASLLCVPNKRFAFPASRVSVELLTARALPGSTLCVAPRPAPMSQNLRPSECARLRLRHASGLTLLGGRLVQQPMAQHSELTVQSACTPRHRRQKSEAHAHK